MSHSTCNFVIDPYDDGGSPCERVAIRRVILAQENQKEMFYCLTHWNGVKDLPLIQESAIEDLVDEEC